MKLLTLDYVLVNCPKLFKLKFIKLNFFLKHIKLNFLQTMPTNKYIDKILQTIHLETKYS